MRKEISRFIEDGLCYGILGFMVIVVLLPILWAFSTSLKPFDQTVAFPPKFIPETISFDSYVELLTKSSMPRFLLNSTIVSIGSVLLALFVGSHAGYAGARLRFRGRNGFMLFILFAAMVPGISILIPLYGMMSRMKLLDSYFVLIITNGAQCIPMAVWLLRGFFQVIPQDLEESARIDGCSTASAFYRIVLPLSAPGLVAAAIYTFIWTWNDFLFGFTLTSSDSKKVIQVGLYSFITGYGIEWNRLCASVILGLIPVLVFFLLLERYFVQGLTAGAVKG